MAVVDFSNNTTSTATPMALCEVVEDHCESSARRFMYNSIATEWARERAEDIQRNLDPKHPSFVKPTQVSGAFMLNPPRFCNEYLSKEDVIFILVKENEEPFTVRFSIRKFSVGWKAFFNDNNLVERDALVFELVKPAKFQAYIIRAYGSSGVDGGLDKDDIEYKVKFTNKGFIAGWSRFSAAHNIGLGDALVFQLITDSEFQVYIIRAYSPGINVLGLHNSEVCAKQIVPSIFLIDLQLSFGWVQESSISSMPSPFLISIEAEKYNADGALLHSQAQLSAFATVRQEDCQTQHWHRLVSISEVDFITLSNFDSTVTPLNKGIKMEEKVELLSLRTVGTGPLKVYFRKLGNNLLRCLYCDRFSLLSFSLELPLMPQASSIFSNRHRTQRFRVGI
ncbi:hypothetical protein GIB67_020819 [Kingdonia uniflora]|uniref:TF-B3 domain-containing protein n=1 Tax=Kingdonia uniflora TaxID=39325 RepID=A0A7J7M796_9MAGN|nr:hypothetical protein GIB67_020819 [Kingdonia uniflora]